MHLVCIALHTKAFNCVPWASDCTNESIWYKS